MVPDEIGIFPEHRAVTGTLPGAIWAFMGLSGKVKGLPTRGWLPPPHGESELDKGRGRGPPFLLLLPLPLIPPFPLR